MKMQLLAALSVCFMYFNRTHAQKATGGDHEAERLLEQVLSQQDLDIDYDELYESLLHRLSSPINLNKATEEELRSLLILSEQQVQDLFKHRVENGDFISAHELQSIPSLHVDLVRRLLPLIAVESSSNPVPLVRRVLHERNNYIVTRYERILESRKGFTDAVDSLHRFHGTADKWYMRFRVSHPGDFSLGFTVEKDPGESSPTDYFSFHAQIMNQRKLTNLVVGDYQVQFGQGLMAGGGFGIGKGSETVTSLRKSTLGFIPYSSVRESGFFRGLAATFSPSRTIHIHAFTSRIKPDAIIESSTEGPFIRSFQESGLHRNKMEQERRRNITQETHGFVVEYRRRRMQAGTILMTTLWDLPVQPAVSIYDQFGFTGRELTNAGIFANYNIANFTFFGEGARTLRGGPGLIGGVLGSLGRNFDVSIVARRYARDFTSVHGNALSENSSAKNESGIYWGWKHQVTKSVALSGYADLFRFPWMRYRSYTPASSGHELLVRLLWKPMKTASFFVQGREETKARNIPGENTVYRTAAATRRNLCISGDYTVGALGFRTRIQYSALNFAHLTNGFAIAQDVSYEHQRWGLQLRHVLFETDDFDNRQYMYEPDMWLAYSFPAYNGSGVRSMIMARWGVSRHLDLWLRWSRMVLGGVTSSGSGVDMFDGPARNDVKFQVRFRY